MCVRECIIKNVGDFSIKIKGAVLEFYLSIFVTVSLAQDAEVGSGVCAGCHADIFAKYQQTGMARSAGLVGVGFKESFCSRSVYRSSVWRGLSDQRQLSIQLRARGHRWPTIVWLVCRFRQSGSEQPIQCRRTLFSDIGILNYSEAQKWDVSPGYQRKRTVELTRGVEMACLQCHTSRMQPVAGITNRFAPVPFLEGGVSCERCRGGGQAHSS